MLASLYVLQDITSALKALCAPGSPLTVLRIKDRFGSPQDGYRDLILNVTAAAAPVGIIERGGLAAVAEAEEHQGGGASTALHYEYHHHVGELQLHLRAIERVKSIAHVSYSIARGISDAI